MTSPERKGAGTGDMADYFKRPSTVRNVVSGSFASSNASGAPRKGLTGKETRPLSGTVLQAQ